MNRKYWIRSWQTGAMTGPYTLKEALSIQEMRTDPCEILKTVIDVHGKEVK